jgi:threonine aldolase
MIVDLRSDTVTRPTNAMLDAMMRAEVGDDVFGDDPTVNRLQAAAAERSGKAAAIFVPSGTMANQIAIRLHTSPGDEVVMESGAHPFNWEAGAAAMFSGVQIRPVDGKRGILDVDAVAARFQEPDPHVAPLRLVCVEDTSNAGGGRVYPLERLDALTQLAHERGARAHLDGARAFNSVVASGVPLARRARGFDTVSFCFSKGLGAPVGSVLCGPKDLIDRAFRVRKALGGGMRQAGFLAAAALHALEHHVERLREDHVRARVLAAGLREIGIAVDEPETNMIYVTVKDAPAKVAALTSAGVLTTSSATSIRLVTHLDVDDRGVEKALSAFGRILV